LSFPNIYFPTTQRLFFQLLNGLLDIFFIHCLCSFPSLLFSVRPHTFFDWRRMLPRIGKMFYVRLFHTRESTAQPS
jgi:hypothetical protein